MAIYLLVVLHHSISHSHTSEFGGDVIAESTHKHDDNNNVHHEHHFHVGVFHFLGHLFENINHSNDFVDEFLVVAQKSTTNIVAHNSNTTNIFIVGNQVAEIKVGAESLPDPPYTLSVLQKLILSSTPLRAPPSLV